MRDQAWLERLLNNIWQQHFHDIPQQSRIELRWGKRARQRLGSLTYDSRRQTSIIRLTRLFEDPEIPEMIIKAVIVHELCHYAHGFSSSLVQKFEYPHRGDVIRKEFAERGLEDLYVAQKRWLKAHWLNFVKKHYPSLSFRE